MKKIFSIRTKLSYFEVFTKKLFAMKMRKTQILMNKYVSLGLSILYLRKMYEFWYGYIKSKHGENVKLLYNTGNFVVHVKTSDIYKDIADNVETSFDTTNFELDRPLPKEINPKVIESMKDELAGEILKEFVGLSVKTDSYLKGNNDDDKKSKDTKNCIKRKLKFEDYKSCIEAAQIINKINHLEKNKIM